ncbi:MAG: TRAM domain-containing protein, partial [Proteobacteria bacterium]|nr:TRAM domain-containing protein [Pseudomonadota bacterium]
RWVNFSGPASLLQRFVDVVVTEARPHSLRGRLVGAAATDAPITALRQSPGLRSAPGICKPLRA